jgi:ribosomal protein S14
MWSTNCAICSRPYRVSRDYYICRICVRSLTKVGCAGCNRFVYKLATNSVHCRWCVNTFAEEEIICERCGLSDYPFKRDLVHCRKCHNNVARQEAVRSLPKQIICGSCGARKATWKKGEQICRACDDRRRNGDNKCITEGCDKLINNKTTQLCTSHHDLRCSPTILKNYLDHYRSPFPQNNRYMTELSSMIDWAAKSYCKREICKETVRRFRGIGKLFQTYELPETLTWEAIDKALPPLTKKGNRTTTKLIRSSLIDLGHLHAKRGALQDWNTYLKERVLRCASESAPAPFRNDVLAFKAWAETGMLNPKLIISPANVKVLCNTPKAIIATIYSIRHFLS